MKLNEVTETGYYTCELDTERETIFEVIKNTDEVWLKETPEQTLLIDEWTYEYTDEDDRKHYEIYGGNLVSVVNAESFDVVKITDTKYIISGKMGTHLMEDKPTMLEIAEHQLDQLKQINEELQKENEKLKKQLQVKEQESKELKNIINEAKNSKLDLKSFLVGEAVQNEYEQQLDQLKAKNEQLKDELSVIQHNCNREGCKYYDDDTFKVFYECKAQKALQLSANSITTKYCDLLKAIIEIKAICNNNDELQGDFNAVDCDKYKLSKHNLANKILQKIKEYEVEE